MESSIKLGRIFGIPIGVHYSWFLVFLLVTLMLSDEFGKGYVGWFAALATSLLFFLSVLAHELSHSLVALARGIPVKGITLFIFGGVSQISREASRPSTEFIVAVVGPLCSVILGFAFLGLRFALEDVNEDLSYMAELLGSVNIVLGIFNMLPGFPLDGGRVLRAVLWGITHSYWTASRIATMAGLGVALLMVGSGIAFIAFTDSPELGVWWILLGTFLGSVAWANLRQLRHREELHHHTAMDLMNAQCPSVPAELTLSQVVDHYGGLSRIILLLVTRGGRVTGIVTPQSLASIPRVRWEYTTVESVATPLEKTVMVAPQEDALKVLELMEEREMGLALIVSDGAILGCIWRDRLQGFRQPRRAQ